MAFRILKPVLIALLTCIAFIFAFELMALLLLPEPVASQRALALGDSRISFI